MRKKKKKIHNLSASKNSKIRFDEFLQPLPLCQFAVK